MFFNKLRLSNVTHYLPLSTFQSEESEDQLPISRFQDGESGNVEDSLRRPMHRKCFISLIILFVSGAILVALALHSGGRWRPAIITPFPQFLSSPILGTNSRPLYLPAIPNFYVPEVASYNLPPANRPRTPLFIGFTRNMPMLRQAVLGYIAAGWPRSDIIIVDNSGAFDANEQNLLTPDNPFHLDYNLLRSRYGISVLQTPTLLNFAQLQNYFLRTAMAEGWDYFFWSHMDVGILGYEDQVPYRSFYARILEILQETGIAGGIQERKWGVKFFNFDYLTLVNTKAWRSIGQWDTFIPYYATDCDAYGRVRMNGYTIDEVKAGHIFDIASIVEDPESKFFPPLSELPTREDPNQQPNSRRYQNLLSELEKMEAAKHSDSKGRNTWQNEQKGGNGQAWTYNTEGFQTAWWEAAEHGRNIMYNKKWGTRECDLVAAGKGIKDLWAHP